MSLNILGKSIIVAICEIVLFVCGAQTSKSTILKPLLIQRNTCCKFSLLIPTWKHPDVQESKSSPNMNVAKKKMAKYSNFVLPFHNVISRYFMSSSSLKAHTIPIELNWQHQDPAAASKPALVNFFNVPKISKEERPFLVSPNANEAWTIGQLQTVLSGEVGPE